MNFPEHLKYTASHEWAKEVEKGIYLVGITSFAQRELGDIVYVDIPNKSNFKKDEVFGTIEAIKTVADLLMPFDGEILEVNEQLESKPELVNQEPYEIGWIVKIRINSLSQFNELLDAKAYQKLVH